VLRRAEQQLIEDAPVIPLYVYTQKHLQKPYVRDLAVNLVDQPPLWRAWLDPAWRSAR
jgi:oligopeptide transport system substrate-binding protein